MVASDRPNRVPGALAGRSHGRADSLSAGQRPRGGPGRQRAQVAQGRALRNGCGGHQVGADVTVMRDAFGRSTATRGAALTSPWFRFFLTDPAPALRQVKVRRCAQRRRDCRCPTRPCGHRRRAPGRRQHAVHDSLVPESQPSVPDERNRIAGRIRADRGDDGARGAGDDRGLDWAAIKRGSGPWALGSLFRALVYRLAPRAVRTFRISAASVRS
jgi:hypothetical protein